MRRTGMPPPYVLVGHSLGGLYSMYYARAYPQEVAGLVLVDSSHPEQVERCREKEEAKKCEEPWLTRMTLKLLPDAVYGEWRGREQAGREVADAGPFPSVPLVVLTRGKYAWDGGDAADPYAADDWLEMQRELAALSPYGRHIVVKESGHVIQKDEPELVVQAVSDMIDQVRAAALVTGLR